MPDSILLYRFLKAERGLETIASRSLKVGRLKDFNDPFEWRLGFTGITQESERGAYDTAERLIQHTHDSLGILCFCDTCQESVLWSHYADHHRGLALEVDYVVEPEQLVKMHYTDLRPTIDVNQLRDIDEGRRHARPVIERLIRQKSSGWAYEREYRAFLELNKCEQRGEYYFTPIPDSFMTRVILGYRCPLSESKVRRALDESNFQTVGVVRAGIDNTSYSVIC